MRFGEKRIVIGCGPSVADPFKWEDQWGVIERNGVEVAMWVKTDAPIDAYIDARNYEYATFGSGEVPTRKLTGEKR